MPAKSRSGLGCGYRWNCCGRHYDPGARGYEAHQDRMTILGRQTAYELLPTVANKGQI